MVILGCFLFYLKWSPPLSVRKPQWNLLKHFFEKWIHSMPLSWTVLLYAVASLWPKLDYNVACTNASKLFNLSQFFWELDNLRNYFLVFRRCIPLVSQHNRPPSDSEMWLLIGPLRYWIVNSDETLGLPSYLYGGQVNACAEALKKSACLQASAFEHILMKISVRKNEKKKSKNQKSK